MGFAINAVSVAPNLLVSGGVIASGRYIGVQGSASGTDQNRQGIRGEASGGYAGLFNGGVTAVFGTLTKTAGSFLIDHPTEPDSKFLYHSFVESPDMKNIYDGVATTDANGQAIVELPQWFEALNMDFRYQLTCIGQFAQAIIEHEIDGNRFAIKTDKPQVKVSWQVTGIRHDPYAVDHRIPLEQVKRPDEMGKFIYPKGYGRPEDALLEILKPVQAVNKPVPITVDGQKEVIGGH